MTDHFSAGPMAERDTQIRALAEEFPGWEAWVGLINGLWHARRVGAVPPVMVHAESADGIRDQITRWTGGHPGAAH